MSNATENKLLFINLDSITDLSIWGEQLSARLANLNAGVKVGDIVIALQSGSAIAAGRITAQSHCKINGHLAWTWVRINLSHKHMPIPLSEQQKAVLKTTAQRTGNSYPGFESVLVIPAADVANFSNSLAEINSEGNQASSPKQAALDDQLLCTICRTDVTDADKVELCNALLARGDFSLAIVRRDIWRIDTDHNLVLVPTRIVPWECCTDWERTDPNNYILLDQQLADHFEFGLISFYKNGRQIQDPAMDEDVCDPWIDLHFTLPKMNKDQKKYMDWHRAHIFKQWRSGASKPMYVQGK